MSSPVIFVMGVSGSGKTLIGQHLAQKLAIPFLDADDFHPLENITKMKAGIALDDNDRKDWLSKLNNEAKSASEKTGVVIACSALKEKYRKLLASGIQGNVYWIYLEGSPQLIADRLALRKGHYMPASLLASQFETLEVPAYGLKINIEESPEVIIEKIITHTGLSPRTS